MDLKNIFFFSKKSNMKKMVGYTCIPGVATDMEFILGGGIFYVKHRIFRTLPDTVVVHHLDSQIPEVVPGQFMIIAVPCKICY